MNLLSRVRLDYRPAHVAPTGSTGLANLRQALDERIATGEIEWLDPVEGALAKVPAIFDRLRRKPFPHVLHFLGHGGINKEGQPCLRLGDDNDEEKWLPVEILAQQLDPSFRSVLRLVVLEACEGAKGSTSAVISGSFTSAAQILAHKGADAVMAFVWPIQADVAQTWSTQFYRALTSADRGTGDVAAAANEARRAVVAQYDSCAAAFHSVVYLRAPEGRIFNFKNRHIKPPEPVGPISVAAQVVPPALTRILRVPFSLVLGDRLKNDGKALDKFRDNLRHGIPSNAASRNGLPMSTLAQWFALHRGTKKLDTEFQKAFRASTQPPIISLIAQLLQPGVHTTLLRTPWLEKSLADAQPDRTMYVIQPQDGGALVMKREAGAEEWEELEKPPGDMDLDEVYLILRPYRGYRVDDVFTSAVVTEDEYHQWLPPKWLDKVVSMDVANVIDAALQDRPALMLGLSMLTANHRMLLQALHPRAIPQRSLALLDDGEDGEAAMWTSGAGLPGKNAGIEVLEVSTNEMQAAFEAIAEVGG
ncbi:MAG TPA: CHAT domain-containing protein [Polyangium sp.]|nr:CHAT domain-containing protein [Polyangium sp.]